MDDDLRLMDGDPQRLDLRQAMADLLVDGFAEHWPEAWPTLAAALEEVDDCLAADYLCRLAVTGPAAAPQVLGWIGGRPEYDGRVCELHPLVVRADQRRRGVGRRLVADLEARARARGALTMLLGTDDEAGMTTLANVDLYQDTGRRLAEVRNLRGHPYEFYQKLGYTVVGVVPDANGPGRPDILMAKRLGLAPS